MDGHRQPPATVASMRGAARRRPLVGVSDTGHPAPWLASAEEIGNLSAGVPAAVHQRDQVRFSAAAEGPLFALQPADRVGVNRRAGCESSLSGESSPCAATVARAAAAVRSGEPALAHLFGKRRHPVVRQDLLERLPYDHCGIVRVSHDDFDLRPVDSQHAESASVAPTLRRTRSSSVITSPVRLPPLKACEWPRRGPPNLDRTQSQPTSRARMPASARVEVPVLAIAEDR